MNSNTDIVRQMPVSVEAEQALLGSIIVSADAFDKISGMINVDDFYVTEHKHIYTALLSMYAKSKTIDVVTLVNALVEQGDRDEAGGIQYISLLAGFFNILNNTPSPAGIFKSSAIASKNSFS